MSVRGGRFWGEPDLDWFFFGALPRQVLHVVKCDIDHEADQQHSATGLNRADDSNADGLAPNTLNDGEHDMAAVQHRDRQHVENGQIYVHQNAEPEREPPTLL